MYIRDVATILSVERPSPKWRLASTALDRKCPDFQNLFKNLFQKLNVRVHSGVLFEVLDDLSSPKSTESGF